MQGHWLRHYPEGVPEAIDINQHASLVDLLDTAMRVHRRRSAFECLGNRLSYVEFDGLSQAFASWLQNHIGLQTGERVAIMLPNLLQFPVAAVGALRAGGAVVNINPRCTQRELRHLLTDSGARVVIVAEPFAHTLAQVIDETPVEQVVVSAIGDLMPLHRRAVLHARMRYLRRSVPDYRLDNHVLLRDALAKGREQPMNRCVLTHDDIAFLQYTGGTTGPAKGAVLTHGNMVANVLQARAWVLPWVEEGRERMVTILPLHHAFALTANLLVFFSIGGSNLLIPDPGDRAILVRELAARPFTAITGVNTLFNLLLNTKGFGALDFSRLHLTLGGGSAIQRAVAERWRAITGCPIVQAYGLTEAAPAVTMTPLDRPGFDGRVGLPLPSTEVVIRDASGEAVDPGTAGELHVRGPQVMREYWQQPEATRAAIGDDGFLRTGDIAIMDRDGFVTIVERSKDVVLVSGFNVYPTEVEAVVAGMDGVIECACIGVPDPETGEAVELFVVRSDESVDEASVQAWCGEHLSRYKLPRAVHFIEELPKSAVGKVLRRRLREMRGA